MGSDNGARPVAGRSVQERARVGRQVRVTVPRSSHAELTTADRPDPVAILQRQAASRVPALVPIRHGRMSSSPFAFYRGGAAIMAADLAKTPTTPLHTQLCGDMHLANFGLYGSPERDLVFDINDFDETLVGPFEWDVKRMAASFVVCAPGRSFTDEDCDSAALASVATYRRALARFGSGPHLNVWYARVSAAELRSYVSYLMSEGIARRTDRVLQKARRKNSYTAARKLTEVVGGHRRFIEQPPLISRSAIGDDLRANVQGAIQRYRATLSRDRQRLLDRYTFVDIAHKVVGVGSVGTRAIVVLLEGRDPEDLLVLQVKEAQRSVLEDHLPRSRFRQAGRRVVEGQRLMQATSDIFLGWVTGLDGTDYYVRQLHDMKGSLDLDAVRPAGLVAYARLCGYVLARGHARSGDAVAISSYLGKGDSFDRAVLAFARTYADVNRADHERMVAAVADGTLEAVSGL